MTRTVLFFTQYKSRYEGDLVAKCYFAKHKLVWEVLDGGLKNKIEIQWSDIMALKARCPDDGPSTLDVVVFTFAPFFFYAFLTPLLHCHFCVYGFFSMALSVCSLLDNLFSLGRQIHNLGNTHYGRQHLTLLVDKLVYTGT